VKCFVSLHYITEIVGLLGQRISPSEGRNPTQDNTNTEDIAEFNALSGIPTYDPSGRAGEEILCLNPRGQTDRLIDE
jgi:hypothetical protein